MSEVPLYRPSETPVHNPRPENLWQTAHPPLLPQPLFVLRVRAHNQLSLCPSLSLLSLSPFTHKPTYTVLPI